VTGWMREALEVSGLGATVDFPRDLVVEASAALPVTRVLLQQLTSAHVAHWCASRGIPTNPSGPDRVLHGAIVARFGNAVIFIDANDDVAEQLYSFGHELAHFIIEDLMTRARALRVLGEGIRPVLDGMRPATPEERISSVLTRVSLDTRTHLMARTSAGRVCTWAVDDAERMADDLALELLAPRARVRSLLRGVDAPLAAIEVQRGFGLPASVAAVLVEALNPKPRSPSTLDLLNLE